MEDWLYTHHFNKIQLKIYKQVSHIILCLDFADFYKFTVTYISKTYSCTDCSFSIHQPQICLSSFSTINQQFYPHSTLLDGGSIPFRYNIFSNIAIKQKQIAMIQIKSKNNPKLLETFNNDPYSNIVIQCRNNITLNLSLSHLSIDSEYFDKVDMDCNSVNLKHLPEKPLIKVLRSLYGDQLKVHNVRELNEVYEIIQFLEIQDYKQNIVEYIEAHSDLMDDLELLEFCYKNNLLKEEIKAYHFKKKLFTLSHSRNYLKLDKLSDATINSLLIEYFTQNKEEEDCFQIINSVLENYFGRNQIKPSHYFSIQAINRVPGLANLQAIWEKFHHSISYLLSTKETIKQSQLINNATNAPYSQSYGNLSMAGGFSNEGYSQSNLHMTTGFLGGEKKTSLFGFNAPKSTTAISKGEELRKNSYMSTSMIGPNFSQEVAKKDAEILELERQLQLKKQIIISLKTEIENAKIEQGRKEGSIVKSTPSANFHSPHTSTKINSISRQPLMESISDEDEESILSEVKRSKRNSVVPGSQYDTSIIQPAFDKARKINSDNQKQVKTISRLNNRRIFN